MNLAISFFIALRYWRTKSADRFGRLVTNLASIGIVLGVMALIIILSVMNGLETHQKAQVLSNLPHAIVMNKQSPLNLSDYHKNLPKLDQLLAQNHSLSAINSAQVVYQTANSVSIGKIIGVRNVQDDDLLHYLDQKKLQQLLPQNGFKLIIGSRLALQLGVKVGDKIRLLLTDNGQYTPFGRMPIQRLFTVSAIYSSRSEVSSYQSFSNLTDVGRLMRIKPEQVQGVRLFLRDPFAVVQLEKFFPQQDWRIEDWRSQKGEFFQAVRMEKNMMGLLISLIIVVAVSNIMTSLSLMVVDKQGEIAILQTQGMTKKQIAWIFVLQGLLVGLVGTLIGSILGVLVVLNLNDLLNLIVPTVFLPTQIDPLNMLSIVAFCLALSFCSTLYPAYRASKIEPAQALRYQ